MQAKLDTLARYHSFAGVLFATAADPRSPLNPWSEASAAVRGQATKLFGEVVAGSDARVPKWLQSDLPRLLWTYHMGIILFWVHDRSPGCRASYRLARRSVDLIDQLLRLSRLPVLRSLVRSAVQVMQEIEDEV
jgi:hypothetical protein